MPCKPDKGGGGGVTERERKRVRCQSCYVHTYQGLKKKKKDKIETLWPTKLVPCTLLWCCLYFMYTLYYRSRR